MVKWDVLLRTYVGGIPRTNEAIKLHLKKGNNQLVVKLITLRDRSNLFDEPNVKQEEYKLLSEINEALPEEIHHCSLGMAQSCQQE